MLRSVYWAVSVPPRLIKQVQYDTSFSMPLLYYRISSIHDLFYVFSRASTDACTQLEH
jgi:hypothetical protein